MTLKAAKLKELGGTSEDSVSKSARSAKGTSRQQRPDDSDEDSRYVIDGSKVGGEPSYKVSRNAKKHS